MNGDLVIAMMGLFAIVFTLVVLAVKGKKPAKPISPIAYSGKMAGPNSEKQLVNTQRSVVAKRVKPSFLRGLPGTFYLVACLTFFAYVFVWADSHNNISPRDIDGESGRLVVEGLLTAIAIFAGGRTIELLQNIDDELYRKRMSESP